MAPTYRLEFAQLIPRPLGEVFPFFADADNLEAITPEWLHFQILTPRPIAMRAGALIEYQLALFGLPLRWKTRIELFEPPRRFVDTQIGGPYKVWRHTHEFVERDGGTWMLDRVEYQLYCGPIGWAANRLFVRRMLTEIFAYRHRKIAQILPSHSAPAAAIS